MSTITIERAFQMAATYQQMGQLAAAEALCRQILAVQPLRPDVLHLLGLIALGAGRHQDALERFSEAARLAPERAIYHSDSGTAHRYLGRSEEAIVCFRRALAVDPQCLTALTNLSDTLLRLGQAEEAIEFGERAVAVDPNHANAHNNLGNALTDEGRYDEAVRHFHTALALNPSHVEAHNNLGYTFRHMDRWEEAIGSCQRALALAPDFAIAHVNLGTAHLGQRHLVQAESCFRRAIELRPDYADAHWNRGLALMLLGRDQEGWPEFEWRRQSSIRTSIGAALPEPRVPQWDGTPAVDQTILVYPEQGYGDTIQFSRYLPLVRERAQARRVIFLCPSPLARVMKETGGWNADLVTQDCWDEAELPEFDRHISLLSLPLALHAFHPPLPSPSFQANAELRAAWQERVHSGAKFRVGLAWTGSPTHVNDRRRSIDPSLLSELIQIPEISTYSLQAKPTAGMPDSLAKVGLVDLTTHIADFADTAAFMTQLDLIISVDTAVAHLAGALGRPTWTLLPFVPDWRWGLEGEDTPWYSTMRLFRQPSAGDWASVVRRVTAELRQAASGK